MSVSADDLIRVLAEHLASFQQPRERYGLRHIGVDMSLCMYHPGWHPACSPRCAGVRSVLERAADYLGCTVDDFRVSSAQRVKSSRQGTLL